MRTAPAELVPGAIMLQINTAGANKGNVGIWNTQITFGGTADTTLKETCDNQDTTNCRSAYLWLYLMPTSSAHIQNVWVWKLITISMAVWFDYDLNPSWHPR